MHCHRSSTERHIVRQSERWTPPITTIYTYTVRWLGPTFIPRIGYLSFLWFYYISDLQLLLHRRPLCTAHHTAMIYALYSYSYSRSYGHSKSFLFVAHTTSAHCASTWLYSTRKSSFCKSVVKRCRTFNISDTRLAYNGNDFGWCNLYIYVLARESERICSRHSRDVEIEKQKQEKIIKKRKENP